MPADTWNEDSFAQTVRTLLPDETARRKCLTFFADSINTANGCSPHRWGVTINPYLLRLNVGKIEVFTIVPDVVHCLTDLDTIPTELRAREDVYLYGSKEDWSLGYYESVPKSVCCNIPADILGEVIPLVQRTHHVLIENAARTAINPMTRKAHSPDVIEHLSSYLGYEIPQPNY